MVNQPQPLGALNPNRWRTARFNDVRAAIRFLIEGLRNPIRTMKRSPFGRCPFRTKIDGISSPTLSGDVGFARQKSGTRRVAAIILRRLSSTDYAVVLPLLSMGTMNDTESINEEPDTDRWLVGVLRLGTFLCFAGWSWVHYYWEAPYGVLVWNDATYGLASRLGVTWDEFVGTGASDGWIQKWLARVAWLYLACTVLTLTVRKGKWFQMTALIFGAGMLTVLSYAKYASAQRQLPMFIEHGGQMLMPVLLVMAIVLGARHRITVLTAMVAMVMTFAGHGSYAMGLWPTPSSFFAMTSVILQVEYDTAKAFLRTAGVLDFVVCIGIFIPWTRRISAAYAAVWGFLTAVARPVAGMSWSLYYWGADHYVHEAVLRSPHWIIPLYLFVLWQSPILNESLDTPRTRQVSPSPTPLLLPIAQTQ
jgi:hypothetical protein